MKLLYEFIQPPGPNMTGLANLYGDLPEFAHALRHIPFSKSLIRGSNSENNRHEINHFRGIESWAEKLSTLESFQVWQQGDDGNEMPVGAPTSERDAQCWVKELESHGHKQIYWCRQAQVL